MKQQRYYWVGSDLDELERIEAELEAEGTLRPQIHLLTLDESAAHNRHQLNKVQSLMTRDLLRSGLIGLTIGCVAAALVLTTAALAGWTDSAAGWTPFIFLAVVLLGFSTWEGGLWGIQTQNATFRRFREVLQSGQHVFFVDLEPSQASRLEAIMQRHGSAEFAGTDRASPRWMILWQHRLNRFFTETMP